MSKDTQTLIDELTRLDVALASAENKAGVHANNEGKLTLYENAPTELKLAALARATLPIITALQSHITKLEKVIEQKDGALSLAYAATSHLRAIKDITDGHVAAWCNDADKVLSKSLAINVDNVSEEKE